jgi:hypothetical protein
VRYSEPKGCKQDSHKHALLLVSIQTTAACDWQVEI